MEIGNMHIIILIFVAKWLIGKLTPSFQFLSINGGRLTVDGDVDGLDICVDVIDSCALVRPRSLPADRWDFQVLVIWCHVPYERSRTHKAEKNGRKRRKKWRRSFRGWGAESTLVASALISCAAPSLQSMSKEHADCWRVLLPVVV